jgi:hypothetical protein
MHYAPLLLLLILPTVSAQSLIPPDAAHCSLISPPANAGEDNPQGGLMKFYPRAKDLPASYTGCQVAWLLQGGEWMIFSKRYYSEGILRAFYGPILKGETTSVCGFSNGQLTPGSKGSCPSFAEASRPAPSLPPGCVTKPATANCSKYE